MSVPDISLNKNQRRYLRNMGILYLIAFVISLYKITLHYFLFPSMLLTVVKSNPESVSGCVQKQNVCYYFLVIIIEVQIFISLLFFCILNYDVFFNDERVCEIFFLSLFYYFQRLVCSV